MSPTEVLERLEIAHRPEEIFGPVDQASKEFRRLAMVVHPDVAGKDTEEIFKKLEQWWQRAEARIKRGTYGDAKGEPILIAQTKKYRFEVLEQFAEGDICNLHLCEW